MMRFSKACLLVLVCCVYSSARAQYPAPYDAFQASADAARRYDAKQRQAIGMQLQTIDQMKWYSAVGAAGFGTVYYRDPPSLDYVYATGRWSAASPYSPLYGQADIFSPWPYVPGDIWGYRWNATVRQPIGRREVKTGPNRWESHPIYADEIKPPALNALPPAPPLEVPVAPPKAARPSVPRQF
jgi:hypothetical protein